MSACKSSRSASQSAPWSYARQRKRPGGLCGLGLMFRIPPPRVEREREMETHHSGLGKGRMCYKGLKRGTGGSNDTTGGTAGGGRLTAVRS